MKDPLKEHRNSKVTAMMKRIANIIAEAILFVVLASWMTAGVVFLYSATNWIVVLSVFVLGVILVIIKEVEEEKLNL